MRSSRCAASGPSEQPRSVLATQRAELHPLGTSPAQQLTERRAEPRRDLTGTTRDGHEHRARRAAVGAGRRAPRRSPGRPTGRRRAPSGTRCCPARASSTEPTAWCTRCRSRSSSGAWSATSPGRTAARPRCSRASRDATRSLRSLSTGSSASASAANGTSRAHSSARASTSVKPRSVARSESSRRSRVLPMPGSPSTSSAAGSPATRGRAAPRSGTAPRRGRSTRACARS